MGYFWASFGGLLGGTCYADVATLVAVDRWSVVSGGDQRFVHDVHRL